MSAICNAACDADLCILPFTGEWKRQLDVAFTPLTMAPIFRSGQAEDVFRREYFELLRYRQGLTV